MAAIRRSRGGVGYDWQYKNGQFDRNARPWAPRWLVDRVGVDYFGRVVFVRLGGSASDAEMWSSVAHASPTPA